MTTFFFLLMRIFFSKDPSQIDFVIYFICFLIEKGVRNISFKLNDLEENLYLNNILRRSDLKDILSKR